MTNLGANTWLVDEMYAQFVTDPDSVSPTWREYLADYKPSTAAQVQAAAKVVPVAVAPNGAATDADVIGEPIRGAGAAIAANMERSLSVPTATGFRNVPAKLLEVNRSVINGYRVRSGQGKVSFTHLIGYAVVRAIAEIGRASCRERV